MPRPRVTASWSRYQPPPLICSACKLRGWGGGGGADAAAPTMHWAAGHRAPRWLRAASRADKGAGRRAAGGGPAGWEDAAGRALALSISDARLPPPPTHTPPQWQCPGGSSSLCEIQTNDSSLGRRKKAPPPAKEAFNEKRPRYPWQRQSLRASSSELHIF